MKNITVSLDDDLYRKARVAAAESDRSVTALVREFLIALAASRETNPAATPAETIIATINKIRKRHPGFDPESRLSREEIHTR